MCEGAMVQNEVLDVFQDDFSALGDEDAGAGSRQVRGASVFVAAVCYVTTASYGGVCSWLARCWGRAMALGTRAPAAARQAMRAS